MNISPRRLFGVYVLPAALVSVLTGCAELQYLAQNPDKFVSRPGGGGSVYLSTVYSSSPYTGYYDSYGYNTGICDPYIRYTPVVTSTVPSRLTPGDESRFNPPAVPPVVLYPTAATYSAWRQYLDAGRLGRTNVPPVATPAPRPNVAVRTPVTPVVRSVPVRPAPPVYTPAPTPAPRMPKNHQTRER